MRRAIFLVDPFAHPGGRRMVNPFLRLGLRGKAADLLGRPIAQVTRTYQPSPFRRSRGSSLGFVFSVLMKAMLLNWRKIFHLQTILTLAVDQTATIKAALGRSAGPA